MASTFLFSSGPILGTHTNKHPNTDTFTFVVADVTYPNMGAAAPKLFGWGDTNPFTLERTPTDQFSGATEFRNQGKSVTGHLVVGLSIPIRLDYSDRVLFVPVWYSYRELQRDIGRKVTGFRRLQRNANCDRSGTTCTVALLPNERVTAHPDVSGLIHDKYLLVRFDPVPLGDYFAGRFLRIDPTISKGDPRDDTFVAPGDIVLTGAPSAMPPPPWRN
jgi:hypothetical protein